MDEKNQLSRLVLPIMCSINTNSQAFPPQRLWLPRQQKISYQLSSFYTGMAIALLSLCTFSVNALSVTTANTIKGTVPYIEIDGVRVTDFSHLFPIKVGGNTYISDAMGNMNMVGADGSLTPVTVITLPNKGDPFNSVGTIAPPDTTAYSLNSTALIPNSLRKDDDGDDSFTLSGDFVGEWKDRNRAVITNLTGIPNLCSAPYTLTLQTTGSPSISTQYGDPQQTRYGNSRATFTINPAGQPKVCFAKPDMSYGTGAYAGPTSMWDTTKGFIPQSVIPATYGSNFPTTGANGLYFDLYIGGAVSALTWPPVTVGNITATMSNITSKSVRVTLTGPVASSIEVGATAPAAILPATFELRGNNGATTVVTYGFSIQKWFVNRGNKVASAANQAKWCSGLAGNSYVLTKVVDLTNANGKGWTGGLPGQINKYQRRVGGGLFSEWGYMRTYTGADFQLMNYWTSNKIEDSQFYSSAHVGTVSVSMPSATDFGMCTQP